MGSQYTSNEFQQLMQLYKIQASMSGKGNCYDNGVPRGHTRDFLFLCVRAA
jgi:hypothetical protein